MVFEVFAESQIKLYVHNQLLLGKTRFCYNLLREPLEDASHRCHIQRTSALRGFMLSPLVYCPHRCRQFSTIRHSKCFLHIGQTFQASLTGSAVKSHNKSCVLRTVAHPSRTDLQCMFFLFGCTNLSLVHRSLV
jgi:hypothetical protein